MRYSGVNYIPDLACYFNYETYNYETYARELFIHNHSMGANNHVFHVIWPHSSISPIRAFPKGKALIIVSFYIYYHYCPLKMDGVKN